MQNSNWNVDEEILAAEQEARDMQPEQSDDLPESVVVMMSDIVAKVDPEAAQKMQAEWMHKTFRQALSEAPFNAMNSAVVLFLGLMFAEVLAHEDDEGERLQKQKDDFLSLVEDFHAQMKEQKDD